MIYDIVKKVQHKQFRQQSRPTGYDSAISALRESVRRDGGYQKVVSVKEWESLMGNSAKAIGLVSRHLGSGIVALADQAFDERFVDF